MVIIPEPKICMVYGCFFLYSTGDPFEWGSTRGRTSEDRCTSLWMTATTWWSVSACPTASPATWWTATGWCLSSRTSEAGCCTSGLASTGISETWKWATCPESAPSDASPILVKTAKWENKESWTAAFLIPLFDSKFKRTIVTKKKSC